MELKTCSKCEEIKPMNNYRVYTPKPKYNKKPYRYNMCNSCVAKRQTKNIQIRKDCDPEFKEKHNNYYRRRAKTEKVLIYMREQNKKYYDDLPDWKIINLIKQGSLKGVDSKDIPQELIEIKRKQLKLHRYVKDQQCK
tara:strand:- start:155 stop:568 length:414 start_codon:yes stop_codon:yes gene_type:complete